MDTGMDITHDVFNQPDALCGYNLFDSNAALRDQVKKGKICIDLFKEVRRTSW